MTNKSEADMDNFGDKIIQKESIKITKTRNGHSWELKFFVENSSPERNKRIEDTIRDLKLGENMIESIFEKGSVEE